MLMIIIQGSYSYKFQYAQSTFGWTSENVAYWISLVGAARAIHLVVILPCASHYSYVCGGPKELGL
jgi:hypothetical protein